jgi:predicted amidohydrolase
MLTTVGDMGALAGDSSATKTKQVRVAGIVLKWVQGEKEANYVRAEALIREAAAGGAKIVCTTECFLDGYAIGNKGEPPANYRDLAESVPNGTYFRRMSELCRELKLYLIAGIAQADGDKIYNAAAIIGPEGELVGVYHKQELEHEAERMTPGHESPVFSTEYGRMGVMICADRRHAGLVRNIASAGADFLICPSGGMAGPKDNDHILQDRSRENHKYIVFVHPKEFLVTAPDGAVAAQTMLGDAKVVAPDELHTDKDSQGVFYFDLPLSQ